MNICGIVIAKENSTRFPGKNSHEYKGKPLFMHSVDLLNRYVEQNNIFIATDSSEIRTHCKWNDFNVIHRGENLHRDDEPYFNVLKYAYQNIKQRFDIIITILANSVKHDLYSIGDGLIMLGKNPELSEIRSFDDSGNQSGIFIFRESVFQKDFFMLNHIGSIKSNGKEIHYKEELDERTKMA